MRITAFFLFVLCMQVSATGLGQKITLSLKDVPLSRVFDEISRQAGVSVVYKEALLANARPVNINVRDASIQQVLTACLKDQPFSYRIEDGLIVIQSQPAPMPASPPTPDSSRSIDIHGHVSDSTGHPLVGATILVKGSRISAITDQDGNFLLTGINPKSTLLVSSIGYGTREYKINGKNDIAIQMKIAISQLGNVEVTYSNGYQAIPKERATGSFDLIDNKLINRSVSSDILSRLQGVTSGLLYDNSFFNIRGRSTIFANNTPLIVLDNFAYDGDINNINPNDIESVTILKDAAAASIWGAKAGNGVIVITTKKGKYNQPIKVSINSNLTIGNKPDLIGLPLMSSADYIEAEKFLYSNNYYQYIIQYPQYFGQQPISPVVDLLTQASNGQISQSSADLQINSLSTHDIRNDYLKYLYRKSSALQNSISLSGGSENQHYYLSIGFDNNQSVVRNNNNNRLSIDANNTYSLINHRLDLTARVIYTQTSAKNNGIGYGQIRYNGGGLYPYAQLADQKGNPLTIPQYNQTFLDTAGNRKFLDWSYNPINEIKVADNTITNQDYQATLSLNYKFLNHFNFNLYYLYGKGGSIGKNLYNLQTFYTRDLINQFTSENPDGTLAYAIPVGGILDQTNTTYRSQNFRGQMNFNDSWAGKHQVVAIAGVEVNDLKTSGYSDRFYGYDDVHATSIPVDYVNYYTNFISQYSVRLPNSQNFSELNNRYLSFFGNVSYTYQGKYIVSASARKNESNLFGVKENQKGVPLWSTGLAWMINKENFYNLTWLPELKLRGTFGYSGNVDKTVTAFLVTRQIGLNSYNSPESFIINPPNPELRWEKDGMFNLALDFTLKQNRVSGSLDYYVKKGTDLLGYSPVPLSTGLVSYKGNTADMNGHGIDLKINSINLKGRFRWSSQFLFSLSKDRIAAYKVKNGTLSDYVNSMNPVVGKPVSALYSYCWGGLDSAGNPTGFSLGKKSSDYGTILTSTDLDGIVYNGPQQPTIFGGVLNTFNYNQVTLSFNIVYKMGYYFRRPSINYTSLFTGNVDSKDFEKRWQQPGDENHTDVPSMVYPNDPNRNIFYQASSVLVEKGDHIRLQDIQLSYDLNKNQIRSMPFDNVRIYGFVNNIGILWRANRKGIDPDAASSVFSTPTPRSFSIGLKIDL